MSQDIGNRRTCNCGSGGGHFSGVEPQRLEPVLDTRANRARMV